MRNLPILQIVKHSLLLPVFRPVPFLKPLGILFGLFVAAFFILFFPGQSGTFMSGESQMQRAVESMPPVLQLLTLSLMLAIFPALLMAMANVFNFGVRVGAFGFDRGRFPALDSALAASAVNGIKFIGIGILILIVVSVLFAVLSVVGVIPNFMGQTEANDIAAVTRAQLLMNILATLVSCGVYSVFSSNLTQTALGSDKEGMTHPYNVDFAIILFLIYMVLVIPVTVAGLMGSMILALILNLALGLWVAVAVGVSHGLRYWYCTASYETEEPAINE